MSDSFTFYADMLLIPRSVTEAFLCEAIRVPYKGRRKWHSNMVRMTIYKDRKFLSFEDKFAPSRTISRSLLINIGNQSTIKFCTINIASFQQTPTFSKPLCVSLDIVFFLLIFMYRIGRNICTTNLDTANILLLYKDFVF